MPPMVIFMSILCTIAIIPSTVKAEKAIHEVMKKVVELVVQLPENMELELQNRLS
jgi:hypothetical protein